jgi:hypothetical protein
VVPSNGDWSSFGEGLRVRDTNKLVFDLSQRPPTLLRPRLLSDGIYVLEVAAVDNLHYAPGAQCLSCVLTPPLGPPVRLVRTYDGAAPGALSDLAQALSGKAGALRFVSGSVRATSRGPEIEPIGVVTDRFHVPDLADPNDGIELLQSAAADTQDDHLKHALEEAARTLDDAAHHGLRRASRSYSERLQRQAYELRRTGLTQLALRFDALHSALNASLASGNLETETQLVTRWADAAIRVHLCQQQV